MMTLCVSEKSELFRSQILFLFAETLPPLADNQVGGSGVKANIKPAFASLCPSVDFLHSAVGLGLINCSKLYFVLVFLYT